MRPFVPLFFILVVAQTTFSLTHAANIPPPEGGQNPPKPNPAPRQIADEDDIDTDGPYGYIPRVVHGVNKIVKGVLTGSPHSVFHGAFGIAPDDVAEDLIGTYNQIMGIPDTEDLDLDETTEKKSGGGKKPLKKPGAAGLTGLIKGGAGTNGAATKTKPAGAVASSVSATKPKVNKKKKPVSEKGDSAEDEDEEDDEDDF
ncbi:uncharacterized protein LOC110848924 [Folsomia candida]|uniref:uncharacterized protein LOC110848924 n=1 Tax=Folsomia candida TaxID=158441 RepID=UPI000B8F5C39|nr:uncharacterized protein LOC110848924 [Folsomia candida]